MAFCSGITYTHVDGTTGYSTPFSPPASSCLPNTGTGFDVQQDMVDGSSSIVKPSNLAAYVTTLLTRTQATAPVVLNANNLDPAATFQTKSALLRASIKNEYCYYYSRYIWLLNDVLNTAASTATPPADYAAKKATLGQINSKLNQILQIMQQLVSLRTTSLSGYYGSSDNGVNQLNSKLDTMRLTLTKHSEELQKDSLESDVQSAMIDYTLEKNSSSRNLLAVYGFMNIVAIGMLFYLYRSSKP